MRTCTPFPLLPGRWPGDGLDWESREIVCKSRCTPKRDVKPPFSPTVAPHPPELFRASSGGGQEGVQGGEGWRQESWREGARGSEGREEEGKGQQGRRGKSMAWGEGRGGGEGEEVALGGCGMDRERRRRN